MGIKDLIPWKREEKQVPVKREPTSPARTLRQDMNRLFDEVFGGFGLAPFAEFEDDWAWFNPRVDIVEHKQDVKVSVELPGISAEDIDISLTQHALTISGEKQVTAEDKDQHYYRMERSYGKFQRTIDLPCEIDVDKTEAVFKNGVLTVTVPKTSAGQACQRIPIKRG